MEYLKIKDEELMEDFIYYDAIVLLPPSLTAQWIDTYSDTYVSGSLLINSENHKQIAEQLNTISIVQSDDHMYVINNRENLQQFYRDTGAIRIFIYGLNFSVLAVCLFIIYNILTQYCMKNKREVNLLLTLGMTKRKVKLFFIERAVILSLTSIIISAILEIFALFILRQALHLPISYNDFIIYSLIYSIVFIILSTLTILSSGISSIIFLIVISPLFISSLDFQIFFTPFK